MRLGREASQHTEALARLDGLMEAKRFEEAKRLLLAARESLRRAGLGHGWVSFRLAPYFQSIGAWDRAFESIDEALEQDPLSPPLHETLASVNKSARQALLDPLQDPADPKTPVLYELLVAHGGADEAAHLAMARWRLGQGDVAGAHQLAAAVTLLAPLSAEGWRCRGEAARLLGREEETAACDFEARACASRPPAPFAIPGEALA